MKPSCSPLEIKVWSQLACFTRPEAKAERVSYPVMTPSAARGVLEAIFWHKPMQWRVREIHVLKPIRHASIMRNEVNSKATSRSGGLSITDERTQRHTLALYDVAYLIRADVWLPPKLEIDPAKYRDQFRRRLAKGQCFHRPYLGCREFAAQFSEPDAGDRAINLSMALGLMLFDIAYRKPDPDGKPGPNVPIFWDAALEAGVLRVPDVLYGEGKLS